VAAARGYAWQPVPMQSRDDIYDRLADVIEAELRLDQLHSANSLRSTTFR